MWLTFVNNYPSTDAGVWPNPGIPAVLEQYHIPKVPVKTEMVDSNEVRIPRKYFIHFKFLDYL